MISPKLVEVGRHSNIAILTLSEVTTVSGEAGNFHVHITRHPRYVDMEKCIACGKCAEKCPKKIVNTYDGGLAHRKAAYLKYAQAVPLKYVIDPEHCIYLTRGKCRACEKVCPTGAIVFDESEKEITLDVGAIVLALGAETYDPGTHDTFGYGKYANVVTSLEFERILSASGPYGGHLLRPSDQETPGKIAWLQCIGSRDEHIGAKGYCSAVCCTYAVKEAILSKEHTKDRVDTAIFYIDIRTHGKDFERYYNRAKDALGVRFIKSKVTCLTHIKETDMQRIRYVDEAGRRVEEDFDMVVLSVGLGAARQGCDTANRLGVDLDHYRFVASSTFHPVETSRPGIFVCGTFGSPNDIPSSVIESSAAAGAAGGLLAARKWTLTKTVTRPVETDIRGEPIRVGVFVCRCGTNIASVVNVPLVVEMARGLPGVVHAEEGMFACSQDSLEKMARVIRDKRLNRVVVAACTPRTHEPLFQQTLINSGINKYLFDMANIRNQCSWVHKEDLKAATEKAKSLVRMAVAKTRMMHPLEEPTLEVDQQAMVIGGGVAGMTAARSLSDQGFLVFLVEKAAMLGGNARRLFETWRGENIPAYLAKLVDAVDSDTRISVFLNAQIEAVEGFIGNFKTTFSMGGKKETLAHGVTVIACGASELLPEGYHYGKDSRVMTALELQERIIDNDPFLAQRNTAVFVQCVGSRIPQRPYCSKVCCTRSVNSALRLKSIRPEMDVFILYRDMRTYGLREDLYRRARSAGIMFIRYDIDGDLIVEGDGEDLQVTFTDCVLRRKMEIRPDLLVLASAIVTETDHPLARFFKVQQNVDGFFTEAHVKLRPVDFATDGVFVCGLAHSPKPIGETIVQAQAAATRAAAVLSGKTRTVSGMVSMVAPNMCSRCGICVSVCPFGAPRFNEKTEKAEIEPTLCKGCGLCASSCRSGAIQQKGFENEQIMSMIGTSLTG